VLCVVIYPYRTFACFCVLGGRNKRRKDAMEEGEVEIVCFLIFVGGERNKHMK